MPGLRITGGELRGRKIRIPAHDLRPTSERARQAFFSIVGLDVPGCRFLDLFAGSGIFSLEALSRGAASAVAVEQMPKAAGALSKLSAEWRLNLRVVEGDVFPALKQLQTGEPIDLVYADPPYAFERYQVLLERLDSLPSLSAAATLAIEHRRGAGPFRTEELSRLRFIRTAAYGEVAFSLFEVGVK